MKRGDNIIYGKHAEWMGEERTTSPRSSRSCMREGCGAVGHPPHPNPLPQGGEGTATNGLVWFCTVCNAVSHRSEERWRIGRAGYIASITPGDKTSKGATSPHSSRSRMREGCRAVGHPPHPNPLPQGGEGTATSDLVWFCTACNAVRHRSKESWRIGRAGYMASISRSDKTSNGATSPRPSPPSDGGEGERGCGLDYIAGEHDRPPIIPCFVPPFQGFDSSDALRPGALPWAVLWRPVGVLQFEGCKLIARVGRCQTRDGRQCVPAKQGLWRAVPADQEEGGSHGE